VVVSLGPSDDPARRTTFNEVAEAYDTARPDPPPGLFDTLIEATGLVPGDRVLEVGCGTGHATLSLAQRGFEVVAVELGDALAAVTRRRLSAYPNANVVVSSFEDWPLPSEPFHVVTAFHAWHWLDPVIALNKAAASLRPDGAIAIVGGAHVAGGDTNFFNEMQGCYERFMPGTPRGLRLLEVDEVPHQYWGLENSKDFAKPTVHRWVQITEYTTKTYFDLLRSFSSHIALPRENCEALFSCLEKLLVSRYGGAVRRATLTELCVAPRQVTSRRAR
jgi:SAM-dependent methyltransferase